MAIAATYGVINQIDPDLKSKTILVYSKADTCKEDFAEKFNENFEQCRN